MAHPPLAPSDEALIDDLVRKYVADRPDIERFTRTLRENLEAPPLEGLYHSIRSRTKNPESLRDKLRRKIARGSERGVPFDVSTDTLYDKINDLAGVRLLHLHTDEFPTIDAKLATVLEEHLYTVVEKATARVWDDEYGRFYESLGISVVRNERMYTSVHYVVQANRKTRFTAEIQVRTLAEELWGEVDHAINYPHETTVLACREQILVLARVTSSCTRLVDSIFRTNSHARELGERILSSADGTE